MAELGPDVERGGQPVEHHPGDEQEHSGHEPVRTLKQGQGGVGRQPDDKCANASALIATRR